MNLSQRSFTIQGDKLEVIIPDECDGVIAVQADIEDSAVLTLYISILEIDDAPVWTAVAVRSIGEVDPTAEGVATVASDGYFVAPLNGARRVKLELTTAGDGAVAALGIRYT